MRINKIADDSIIVSYFETMSRYNRKNAMGFIKIASWLSAIGKFVGYTDDGVEAVIKATGIDPAARQSKALADLSTLPSGGIMAGATTSNVDSAFISWFKGADHGEQLASMRDARHAIKAAIQQGDPSTFMDGSGNITNTGKEFIAASLKNKGVLADSSKADEFVDAILSGPTSGTWKGGPAPRPTPTPPSPHPTPTPPIPPNPISRFASVDEAIRHGKDVVSALSVDDAFQLIKNDTLDDAANILIGMGRAGDSGKKNAAAVISKLIAEDATKAGEIMAKMDADELSKILKAASEVEQKSILDALKSAGKATVAKNVAIALLIGGGVVGGGYWLSSYLSGDDAGGRPFPDEGDGTAMLPREIENIKQALSEKDYRKLQENLITLKDSGNASVLNDALNTIMRHYRKTKVIELTPPFITDDNVEIYYAFVKHVWGSKASPGNQTVVNAARKALDDPRGGRTLFVEETHSAQGDAQAGVNQALEKIIGHGGGETGLLGGKLPGRRRSRRLAKGLRVKPLKGRGKAGKRSVTQGRAEKKERRRRVRGKSASERLQMLQKYASIVSEYDIKRMERFDSIQKIAQKASNSTNIIENDDLALFKSADSFSKSYYKDAVTDLNNTDTYLRSYFTGLGKLYDERPETPKGDYKTLYNVSDGTGADLVHEAHPKAIVVLDSNGRGGLVENGSEQQRQTQGVALSAPTGNYRANYAWLRNSLKKQSK